MSKIGGDTYWTILEKKADLLSGRCSPPGATEADEKHWTRRSLAGTTPPAWPLGFQAPGGGFAALSSRCSVDTLGSRVELTPRPRDDLLDLLDSAETLLSPVLCCSYFSFSSHEWAD